MEVNILNPDAKDFPEAFGISPERQLELSHHLNAMMKSWAPGNLLRVHHIVSDIALFCAGPEEFVYCIVLHMGWWQRRGHELAPRQEKISAMSKKKLTYQEIKKAAKKAVKTQERLKRRKESDAYISYQIPKTVFSNDRFDKSK